jgi:hypothetical protein
LEVRLCPTKRAEEISEIKRKMGHYYKKLILLGILLKYLKGV